MTKKRFRFSILPFLSALLSLFLLASLGVNFYLFNKLSSGNIVVEVADGDTFQLASGKRIRLMGVDAPEFDRCGGKEARDRLSSLILNRIVSLKEEASEAYGRTLALIYVNNILVNKVMLEEGWGRTDYRKNSQRDILTAAFHLAQAKQLGIFSSLCREKSPSSPSSCLIKGNIDKNTYQKFYHFPGCRQYDQIVIEKDIGERYFCTEEEASAAGFIKASGCP